MSTLQNAVVVDANGCVSLQRAPIPEPGPDEILVKVVAAAQNPSDWMSSQRAKVAGAIIGFDYAGYVERIGSTTPGRQRTVGERVCGFVLAGYTPNGTFAEFVVAPAHLAVPIPDDWSFEDAAQLALAPFTALQALYESLHGLPTPDAPTRDPWPILIYGGSSSVGVFALQIAKLAGMHVIATASPANFDLVKSFGADEVFDYKDPDVSRRIREATRGKLRYAVDCIANEATLRITANALGDEGGDIAAVLPGNSPRTNVKVTFSLIFEWIGKDYTLPYPFKAAPEHRVRGERFAKMFSRLLNTGSIKPGPVRIMPNGLAGVPDGLKYMLEGKVSGEKLVYVIKDTPSSATTGTSESS